ncbi:hypothetical protein ACDW_24010 [Acidovorax sp. DW039]|uniref:hypothetical protein n=1 Tax=Acidovorax sp. DW039 TaxID=3095606 RepID=UPI003088E560|nr:hypothetical protein ACDW_24010 [Acidovorax sp. DW039]
MSMRTRTIFSRAISGSVVVPLLASLCVMAAPAWADDEASLARGAQEDTTPQQRYQTAIREAGGGLKLNLAACKEMPSNERSACNQQARARYQEEMAAAKELLKNPQARPLNVTGSPIRSTVTAIESKP